MMRFKLLDMPWNLEEQYEILTFPFVEWSWLLQYRVGYKQLRPEFERFIEWVPYYEPGHFDAALLHLDLESIEPQKSALARRRAYEELNAVIERTPKIVIVHGSRVGAQDGARAAGEVRELIGDNHAVVSSAAVAERLGAGHVISPGTAAEHWLDLPKEPRVVTNVAHATGRDLLIIESLRGALEARDILLCRIGVDYVPNTWAEYRDFLGRSLIYFAPASYSERAKTEAMLSGCCVVSVGPGDRAGDGADASEYVAPSEPDKIVELIEELITDPAGAIRSGRRAKTRARCRRDWNRYSQEWLKYLHTVVDGRAAR